MIIDIEKNVFEANDECAEENRQIFRKNSIYVINVISAPGAGKTTVLETLVPLLKEYMNVAVIEGDLYTTKDAQRMDQLGIDVVQINTEGACHLDAKMIQNAVNQLPLDQLDLIIIENVGNLVCPAEFDVGENMKLHIASVTEGDDKPQKYPLIYEKSEVVLLNKIDLAPYIDFNIKAYERDIENINYSLTYFQVSGKTGAGLREVARWIVKKVKKASICEVG